MKTKRKTGIFILLTLAFFCIAYKLYDVKQQKKEDLTLVNKSKSDIPVITSKVRFEVINRDFSYQGTFEPSCEVTVISESQGKVVEYSVDEGDFITEGRIIVRLDNDLYGYQLEIAEAAYLKAQDDLQRFEKLSPGEAVTEQQLSEVKLAFKNAKANYLSVKKQYENTIIKAPISGTISKRYIEKGSLVTPGSPVAEIIDTRKMKFNAKYTATDLIRVRTGQKVRLTSDLYPGIFFTGTIKVIGVKPDNSKRYLVQTEVENNQEKPLIAGIDGTVYIGSAETKCLVIPRNCITGSIIQPKVYVISDNVARLRPVILESIVNDQAVIKSGLTEGETVVFSGQINLEDHARVIVQNN